MKETLRKDFERAVDVMCGLILPEKKLEQIKSILNSNPTLVNFDCINRSDNDPTTPSRLLMVAAENDQLDIRLLSKLAKCKN